MRRSQIVTILGTALFIAPFVLAESLPHRKNGLWETSMTWTQRSAAAIKAQQCIDEKTDEAMQHRAVESGSAASCENANFQKTAGGFASKSVCKTARGTLTSQIQVTGDLQSAYRMEITSHREPAERALADTKTVVDAKWLGACPADMKPGDMKMNGMTMHMGTAPAQRMELIKKQRASPPK